MPSCSRGGSVALLGHEKYWRLICHTGYRPSLSKEQRHGQGSTVDTGWSSSASPGFTTAVACSSIHILAKLVKPSIAWHVAARARSGPTTAWHTLLAPAVQRAHPRAPLMSGIPVFHDNGVYSEPVRFSYWTL